MLLCYFLHLSHLRVNANAIGELSSDMITGTETPSEITGASLTGSTVTLTTIEFIPIPSVT